VRHRLKNFLFELARRGYHKFPVLSIPLLIVTIAAIRLTLLVAPFVRAWDVIWMRRKRRRSLDKGVTGLAFLNNLIESGKAPRGPLRKALVLALSSTGHYCLSGGKLHSARQCLELVIQLADGNSWETMYHFSLARRCVFSSRRHTRSTPRFRWRDASPQIAARLRPCDLAHSSAGRILVRGVRAHRNAGLLLEAPRAGQRHRAPKVVMVEGWGNPSNKTLCRLFLKLGIDAMVSGKRLPKYYDRHKAPDDTSWNALTHEDQRILVDDFWEYEFPDGAVFTYTHGAAKVQQQWEAEQRPPLMTLDDNQRAAAAILLKQLGVPSTAWFVCMHVREAGFHKKWNLKYPSARDSRLADYDLAIKAITDRGGWVVRMGDRTMTPLPKMHHVVDYAHSAFKCEIGDIVLPASARFLLGTNSGFATIPGIYGIPNVLTNWVPVALPLWFGRDLMIPKLFRDTLEQKYVSFHEMFSTRLGALQNTFDFPEHIEIVANTPAEIVEVVVEMMDRLAGKRTYTPEDTALQDRYFELAIEHGSYRGAVSGESFWLAMPICCQRSRIRSRWSASRCRASTKPNRRGARPSTNDNRIGSYEF
jgi:putative glycosyltransferase (TIGR04372 family)